nr:hypothetical protein Iba_chr02aCG10150 [Ipomoea batatas]
MWEDRGQYVVPFGPHAPLGPYVSLAYEHWFYRVRRRLIGNPDHRQAEGWKRCGTLIFTAKLLLSTVKTTALQM